MLTLVIRVEAVVKVVAAGDRNQSMSRINFEDSDETGIFILHLISIMKNLVLTITAIIIISISACTKAAKVIPSGNTFSATVDGKTEEFTIGDTVRVTGTSGIYIAGFNPVNQDKVMIFAGNSGGVLSPGTYYTDSLGVSPKGAQLLFRDGSVSPGTNGYGGYYYTYNSYQGVDYSGSVTFTSITDTLVKGTFTGSLVAENSVAGATGLATRSVTNGKFSIYIKTQP